MVEMDMGVDQPGNQIPAFAVELLAAMAGQVRANLGNPAVDDRDISALTIMGTIRRDDHDIADDQIGLGLHDGGKGDQRGEDG